MKKPILAAVAAVALSLVDVSTAAAITYGVRDNGEHPYVGFMLFFDPIEESWFSCSGTLLDPVTFLTAGHCTFDVGSDGQPAIGGSGGNDVWLTFEEGVDLLTFPRSADFPGDPAALYTARSAWLDANPLFTRGTSFPHPDYAGFEAFPANHDVGVVVLDDPAPIGSYATLAALGTLDALAGEGKNHNKVIVETAGYGIQQIKPASIQFDERWKSTSTIVNLRSALTAGWHVHTSNNPSPANGQGGTCFGDSGGGVFLNDTNVVVAVVSFGLNDNCKGSDYSARADIADTQDFVLGFLGD
jgi:hypothetical protein